MHSLNVRYWAKADMMSCTANSAIGAQSVSPDPWNQFDPCALEATEPSARVYAEPGTMWTTLFTGSF